MTGRIGFGLGGGIDYDPLGGIPGKPPSCDGDSGWVTHVSGKLDLNAFLVGAGIEVGDARNYSSGLSSGYVTPTSNWFNVLSGLELGGSIGTGITYYSEVSK